ncbi:MAG TPA: hypothetical protein PLK34_02800 [Candidatus Pacearchaeota archaeon]|nr:hypothetical protein [Candidatus Pacearchaeota archaeon]
MKKRINNIRIISVTIAVLILLSLILLFLKLRANSSENPEGILECVPDKCCHASECVLKQDAPECSSSFCTMECREGTMDCGAGHCEYLNGKCEVVWNEK